MADLILIVKRIACQLAGHRWYVPDPVRRFRVLSCARCDSRAELISRG